MEGARDRSSYSFCNIKNRRETYTSTESRSRKGFEFDSGSRSTRV